MATIRVCFVFAVIALLPMQVRGQTPAGDQYVAVSAGGAATTPSFLQLTPELRPSNGNNLFVFALPEP